MKKLLFVAAIGVASLVSAKETEKLKDIDNKLSFEKTIIYFPIKLTSSCGYTQYIDYNPAFDSPSCIEVEIRAMEDFCDAPVGWEALV